MRGFCVFGNYWRRAGSLVVVIETAPPSGGNSEKQRPLVPGRQGRRGKDVSGVRRGLVGARRGHAFSEVREGVDCGRGVELFLFAGCMSVEQSVQGAPPMVAGGCKRHEDPRDNGWARKTEMDYLLIYLRGGLPVLERVKKHAETRSILNNCK